LAEPYLCNNQGLTMPPRTKNERRLLILLSSYPHRNISDRLRKLKQNLRKSLLRSSQIPPPNPERSTRRQLGGILLFSPLTCARSGLMRVMSMLAATTIQTVTP
jgi:hypothetical protein